MCFDLDIFMTALKALIAGLNPWAVQGFCSPPWTLLAIVPVVWLPMWLAKAIWMLLSICAFWAVARKLTPSIWHALAFILSYPVLHSVLIGNLDWLVLLALIAPDWLGTLLCLLKPHTSFTLLAKRAYNRRNWLNIVALGLALTSPLFLLIAPNASLEMGALSNVSSFPWFLALGAYLFYLALKQDDDVLALAAACCISPQVSISALPVLGLLVARFKWGWLVLLAQWGLIIVFKAYT